MVTAWFGPGGGGADGKSKWSAGVEAEPTTGYGRSASPIIAAGKQLWVNAEAQSGYGTPTVVKAGETDLIVTPLGDVVRVADGQSVNSGIGRAAQSSPIACGDGVVCFGDSEVHALHLNAAFKEEEVWSGMVGSDVFGSPLRHDNTLFITTGEGELFAFDINGRSVD